ncbi:MAG TPA: hypothetical protein VF741_09970 [Candidatus Aquilonibacter sp.]
MKRSGFIAGSACAGLTGCAFGGGKPATITNLDAHASQLRRSFNNHAGNVRLVLLVSPN